MTFARRSVLAATALALMVPSAGDARRRDDYHRDHRHDRHRDSRGSTAAGVAIGVAILGIAAAAAADKRKREERYRDGYSPRGYEPARGVLCYREERRCYTGGHFSFEWTDNQFGYDPYRRGY